MGNDAVESSGTAHGVFLFPAEEREESRPISRVVFRSLTALHLVDPAGDLNWPVGTQTHRSPFKIPIADWPISMTRSGAQIRLPLSVEVVASLSTRLYIGVYYYKYRVDDRWG